MAQVKVLLVEDHAVVREGLHCLLSSTGKINVVGEAKHGREAVLLAKQLHPDVILMDIGMPELNGFEATRQILAAVPDTRVIVLSAHSDDLYVDRFVDIGASGYLVKHTSASVLSKAILEVAKGNTFFSPSIAKRLTVRNQTSPNHAGLLKKRNVVLSKREVETLQLIAEGKANKQIAAELGIGIKTVEKHRHNLMKKLDIHDTASLTRYAMATGVIENGEHGSAF